MKRYGVREIWIDLATNQARRPMVDRSDSFDDKDRALERAVALREDASRVPDGYACNVVTIDSVTGSVVVDERIVMRP